MDLAPNNLHLRRAVGFGSLSFAFRVSEIHILTLFSFMNTEELQQELDNGLISPKILLSRTRLLTEESRITSEYMDRANYPFWYFLGKQVDKADRVLEVGSGLGLVAACLLQSCKTGEWRFYGGNSTFVPKNIKQHSPHTRVVPVGLDYSGSHSLGILSSGYDEETSSKYLDFLWSGLEPEGLLVADYITGGVQGKVFQKFARVKNREPIIFKTRNGVGILKR